MDKSVYEYKYKSYDKYQKIMVYFNDKTDDYGVTISGERVRGFVIDEDKIYLNTEYGFIARVKRHLNKIFERNSIKFF